LATLRWALLWPPKIHFLVSPQRGIDWRHVASSAAAAQPPDPYLGGAAAHA
jgi:hypothetical protein